MENNVVNIEDHMPWLHGDAYCLGCRHRWIAGCPVGVTDLECPECHSMKGKMLREVIRTDTRWACPCGCEYFTVTPEGVYCPNCGSWMNDRQ
ncbi:hypothetical protein KAR91_17995 [Candidatus Pacearchaeota archaeon]|nr:hypothetical protein [Candidatus Pacearchaeota archaeon]